LIDYVSLIGKKEHDAIISLMNQCDIYLQYSISEGFCNAVLEAQAMNCLCVVSDAEGLAENVIDNITGRVIPKRNPKALAETLLEVIHLPNDDKITIRNKARNRVINTFNLDNQRNEFMEFYKFSPL